LFLKLENILADFLCGEKCFYISFLSKLYLEGCPKIFPETVPVPEENSRSQRISGNRKSKTAISSEKKTAVCEISASCPDSSSGSFAAQPDHNGALQSMQHCDGR
jgi:hypothetical protein